MIARFLRKLADLLDPRVPPSEDCGDIHVTVTADTSQARAALDQLEKIARRVAGSPAQCSDPVHGQSNP
jgi:hypothetical protein